MNLKTMKAGFWLVVVVLFSGCFTAIRPYDTEYTNVPQQSELGSISIAVSGVSEHDVEFALAILKRSAVFEVVLSAQDSEPADLTVKVLDSRNSARCGTPQMSTIFTLGLIPTGNAHRAHLVLEFLGEGANEPVLIERDFYAHTKHGLWALFVRAKKEWTKPTWGEDPAGLAIAIREDLLANESAIVSLVRGAQPNNRSQQPAR